LLGLLKCEKNHTNIERMVEQVPEQAYHLYHNFLSESNWDYQQENNTTIKSINQQNQKLTNQNYLLNLKKAGNSSKT
jgi:hypothetical protein